MDLGLKKPLLVGRVGDDRLLANGDVMENPDTDAQMWSPTEGYSEVKPLQVWLKFLYYVEEVTPPEPWEEPDA